MAGRKLLRTIADAGERCSFFSFTLLNYCWVLECFLGAWDASAARGRGREKELPPFGWPSQGRVIVLTPFGCPSRGRVIVLTPFGCPSQGRVIVLTPFGCPSQGRV